MNTRVKSILKTFGRVIFGIAVFLTLYFSTAFICSRITVAGEKNASDELAIYIKTNGVHTDIVVPAKNELYDWTKEIKFSNSHLKDTLAINYIGLGWGDKGFYLETPEWKDLKFAVAFKASFALSTTAMHATFYDTLKEDKTCRRILVSKEQYGRLIKFVDNTFQHDDSGHVIPVVTTANYSDADAFYEAKGRYNLFKTCNTWTNTALKRCGQKACVWTIFDKGIFLKYD